MSEFKSTISSQDFDKALQGGLDYAADKSGIQEALKELSAKGFVYIGPDQPTDGTMYWLDTSVEEPDVPVVPDEPDVPVVPDEPDEPVVPDNPNEPVYVLASPATFTAADKVLTDTGYVLGDEDKDWTIVSDVSGAPGYGNAAWCCGGELGLWSKSAWSWHLGYSTSVGGNVQVATGKATNMKTVVTHKKGEETLTVYYVSDSALTSAVDSGKTYTAWRSKWSTSTVTLGGLTGDDNRYWTGTVNDFKIYERVLTGEEIEEYVRGAAQAPELTGISAVYSGGDVAVGTALTDLTGIVVTATYSDGSTATVSGYTLSGAIAEGSNTITVTYDGKTATFTVTGVAASDDIHDGYVSDGLEFRQDWIRNTVNGHSSEVTPFTWADVSGNNYATTTSESSFFSNVYATYAEGPRTQQKVTSTELMSKIANSFTAEVVYQPANATSTNGVFSVNNGGNFRLIVENGQFRVCGSGTLYGTAMTNENAIRHLTYVYNGFSIKMYHDGIIDTEIDATMDIASRPFVEFWGNADYAHAVGGKFNAARLYSRALSAEEVKANYDNDVARFGLVNGEAS